jgi:DNA-binding HxlR family transcriptional regulator
MAFQPALCPRFHKAVELIGRRWTGAVIQLLLQRRMRYAELRDVIPEISDRMLSERLRELEEEGIIDRIVIPATPVRVEYDLTTKGRALEPALAAVGEWAQRWSDKPRPERQHETAQPPAPAPAHAHARSARRRP